MAQTKHVYFFGEKTAEGNGEMTELLGAKGANLAEMNLVGMPVPPGFTITTEVCTSYFKLGKDAVILMLRPEVEQTMRQVERAAGGARFGDPKNPLLVSVRSGAPAMIPGMMDTILNLGMNDEVVEVLATKSGNARFAWDSYRRLVQLYGRWVLGIDATHNDTHDRFSDIVQLRKQQRQVQADNDLEVDDLKGIVKQFKELIKKTTGKEFPSDPWEQLWGAVAAVFDCWNNRGAVLYRALHNIPQGWGAAVNVQAMVFGNMGYNSATGIASTRNPSTGQAVFVGEYLINAQGEDVVAGIRMPQQVTLAESRRWAVAHHVSEEDRVVKYPSLEEAMPDVYNELATLLEQLEVHYRDMQDVEFTIQDGRLYILKARTGYRTATAMLRIAQDMLHEGLLDEPQAVLRCSPNHIDFFLQPMFSKQALAKSVPIAQGLAVSPGAAVGRLVFSAHEAQTWVARGKKVILVQTATTASDIEGMRVAEGVLTARGGITSHAATTLRAMGKCCVSGVGGLVIDSKGGKLSVGDHVLKEGDMLSLDGSTGNVYLGAIEKDEVQVSGDFAWLMSLADKYARLQVRANATSLKDATTAQRLGAKGIGLYRTEHMFEGEDRIWLMREMIMAKDEAGRRAALAKLLPLQRQEFERMFESMEGHTVTVRLLDPPLHDFVPHHHEGQLEMAHALEMPIGEVLARIESLTEVNPMFGLRGCRLGNLYPEITEMQVRAVLEANLNLRKKQIYNYPEIMVPLTSTQNEMKLQAAIIHATADKVFEEYADKVDYKVGTMIEVPRAALVADQIAMDAEFFSFGTNDLTQMTFGVSSNDMAKFLPMYLDKGLLSNNPFEVLDQAGVGQLVEMATTRGRSVRPNLKVGICGEHGGDSDSVEFCHHIGLNYVSCSPSRVPIARLAAAHAAIKERS